jgi:hypothetical protein
VLARLVFDGHFLLLNPLRISVMAQPLFPNIGEHHFGNVCCLGRENETTWLDAGSVVRFVVSVLLHCRSGYELSAESEQCTARLFPAIEYWSRVFGFCVIT